MDRNEESTALHLGSDRIGIHDRPQSTAQTMRCRRYLYLHNLRHIAADAFHCRAFRESVVCDVRPQYVLETDATEHLSAYAVGHTVDNLRTVL